MSQKRTDPYYQAQDILSRRDHSEFEVRQKLQRKGFDQKKIHEVIQWLKEKKLLDDSKFANRYVESIVNTKTVGPRWITQKLKQKRVEERYITRALKTYMPYETELDICHRAIESWERNKKEIDRTKRMRFLLSRGFSMPVIQSATNDHSYE